MYKLNETPDEPDTNGDTAPEPDTDSEPDTGEE